MRRSIDPASRALARLYDVDLVDDPGDLDLYLALAARAGGPILELGVGSGRLAVPLARAGWPVTGVDRDPAMLERAQQRSTAGSPGGARLSLVEADIAGLDLGSGSGHHRLGFIAFNTLLQLGSRDAQAGAFRALARGLERGGLAVVDVWLPDADDLARYDGRVSLAYARADPETGMFVVKTVSATHDAVGQTVTLTSIYDEGAAGAPPVRWVREDRLRLVSVDELRWFAEAAGLEIEAIAGDDALTPLGPGSDRAVLIALAPGGRP